MSHAQTSAILTLIQTAAGLTPVVLGERARNEVASSEPVKPYFRVAFLRLDSKTKVSKRLRGIALVECYAVDNVKAWDMGDQLTRAMGLTGADIVAPVRPSPLSDYNLWDSGWLRGNDPRGSGLVYCNIIFHYFL